MTQVTDVDACIERYVRRFRTYDRAVDVVSAFEALFTRSNDLPPTVRHFERFPTVLVSGDEVERTPDFSVAFTDETALIGEVARIALRDESVDSLCEQLAAYDKRAKSRLRQQPKQRSSEQTFCFLFPQM